MHGKKRNFNIHHKMMIKCATFFSPKASLFFSSSSSSPLSLWLSLPLSVFHPFIAYTFFLLLLQIWHQDSFQRHNSVYIGAFARDSFDSSLFFSVCNSIANFSLTNDASLIQLIAIYCCVRVFSETLDCLNFILLVFSPFF